ncbi:MAG: hypothetical protein NZ561_02445 [Phycisphaerae bacterium]|nr:hypothetical protein [Phycisphaerae bacterium]
MPQSPMFAFPRDRQWAIGAATRMFFTLADQAVVSGTSFLCGVIVAKFTSKAQFGLYGLGFTLVMIAAELQGALVSTPQTVFGPKYFGERNRQFQGSMLLKLLLLAALNAALLSIGSAAAALAGDQDFSRVMAALAMGVTGLHLWTFTRIICFSHLKPGIALLVDLITCGLQLGSLLTLWRQGILTAWSAWAVISLMPMMPAAVFLLWWRPKMSFSIAGALQDFAITWRQTRWVLASSLLWVGGTHLYPWVIEVFAERTEVAIWTACFAISAIGNPLMYGVMNMLGPQIAHRHAALPIAQFQLYAWRATLAFTAVMSMFAVAVTLLANWLMVHIYTPEYGGHAHVVAMLAFALVARAPGFIASRGLFVLQRADLELLNNIAPLLMLMALGVPLTSHYGAAGAAFSLLVAQTIGSASRVVCFRRCARARGSASADPVAALGVQA